MADGPGNDRWGRIDHDFGTQKREPLSDDRIRELLAVSRRVAKRRLKHPIGFEYSHQTSPVFDYQFFIRYIMGDGGCSQSPGTAPVSAPGAEQQAEEAEAGDGGCSQSPGTSPVSAPGRPVPREGSTTVFEISPDLKTEVRDQISHTYYDRNHHLNDFWQLLDQIGGMLSMHPVRDELMGTETFQMLVTELRACVIIASTQTRILFEIVGKEGRYSPSRYTMFSINFLAECLQVLDADEYGLYEQLLFLPDFAPESGDAAGWLSMWVEARDQFARGGTEEIIKKAANDAEAAMLMYASIRVRQTATYASGPSDSEITSMRAWYVVHMPKHTIFCNNALARVA